MTIVPNAYPESASVPDADSVTSNRLPPDGVYEEVECQNDTNSNIVYQGPDAFEETFV